MTDNWYYSVDKNEKLGPIPEEQLRAMLADGSLKASDLVWQEGMEEWQTADKLQRTSSESTSIEPSDSSVDQLPSGLLPWMGFVGAMTIVYGVLNLCNLFLGVLLIVAGGALMGARTTLENLPSIDKSLLPFFEKFKTFIMMNGIFYIVSIVIMVLVFIFYIVVFATSFASGLSGM